MAAYDYDLGRYSRPVTTRSPEAQAWFGRGHPENVGSLHGLHECLVRLGKPAEARMVKPRLDIAIAWADVPIEASRFCRLRTAA